MWEASSRRFPADATIIDAIRKALRAKKCQVGEVTATSLSPDKTLCALCDDIGHCYLTDFMARSPLLNLTFSENHVVDAAFHPMRYWIALVMYTGRILIFVCSLRCLIQPWLHQDLERRLPIVNFDGPSNELALALGFVSHDGFNPGHLLLRCASGAVCTYALDALTEVDISAGTPAPPDSLGVPMLILDDSGDVVVPGGGNTLPRDLFARLRVSSSGFAAGMVAVPPVEALLPLGRSRRIPMIRHKASAQLRQRPEQDDSLSISTACCKGNTGWGIDGSEEEHFH